MKKLYAVLALVLTVFVFVNSGLAQGTFTAIRSGNWSNPITWDVNGIPSSTCNNCTITINANVTVNLDRNVTLTGNSILTIGTDATSPAELLIGNSGGSPFVNGFNIILISNGGSGTPPGIKLLNSNTKIVATSAGEWDGILTSFTNGTLTVYNKIVGTMDGLFFGAGGSIAPFLGFPVSIGPTVSGPKSISSSGGSLPIILSDFEAILNKTEVNLSWTSVIEINSDHYSIDRSADGSHWNSIGTVAAKGFSDISVHYAYTDISPFGGVNYYRLALVDRDGKYSYSDVKVVRRFVIGLSIFPNPARDIVSLSFGTDAPSELTIRLVNQNGQVMQERKLNNPAGTTATFAVSSYSQGNYLLEVIDNKGNIQTSKFIIGR